MKKSFYKNKWLLIAVCAVFLFGCKSKNDKPFLSGGKLVWSDEFDGDSLDLAKWNIDTGTGIQYNLQGWGNNEKQVYSPENVIVKNGCLYLEARKDSGNSRYPYTSGKITTGGNKSSMGKIGDLKFAVKPGMRVEARIKSSRGRGFWPAFWMLGLTGNQFNGYPSLGWPRCGEIDILEIRGGQENRLMSTIHYGPKFPQNKSTGNSRRLNQNLADDWNIFGVVWDADFIHFLFNGEIWYTIDLNYLEEKNEGYYIKEAFSAKSGFFININLAVGGNFLSNQLPDDSVFNEDAPYEDRCFMVDWVRVYKR